MSYVWGILQMGPVDLKTLTSAPAQALEAPGSIWVGSDVPSRLISKGD